MSWWFVFFFFFPLFLSFFPFFFFPFTNNNSSEPCSTKPNRQTQSWRLLPPLSHLFSIACKMKKRRRDAHTFVIHPSFAQSQSRRFSFHSSIFCTGLCSSLYPAFQRYEFFSASAAGLFPFPCTFSFLSFPLCIYPPPLLSNLLSPFPS